MNIITCIKQVPASSNVAVDPKTGILIRDGKNVKMNPYDLYALELAFMMKDRDNFTTVTAVTMGPPSASQVLEEALYMGADHATLLSDRRFAGADVLATAYTLSQLIKHIQHYDLIVCGKQTTDGDTAQVGPEIAEFLDIPHVPYVVEILSDSPNHLTLRSSYDTHDEIIQVSKPCLITVDKGHLVPRLPSYRRRLQMINEQITTVSLSDLSDQDQMHYGLNGSPTQVEEIFPPQKRDESVIVNGSASELSNMFLSLLAENRFL